MRAGSPGPAAWLHRSMTHLVIYVLRLVFTSFIMLRSYLPRAVTELSHLRLAMKRPNLAEPAETPATVCFQPRTVKGRCRKRLERLR